MIDGKITLELDGGFCLLLALMLLVLPLPWVLAVVLAAFAHEGFHYAAIALLGGRVYRLRLGFRGARMEMEPMQAWRELVAASAGPVGSGLMILFARWLPRTAVCSLIHCLFNLIPLFPLDGGRMVRSAMMLLLHNGEGKFVVFQKILVVLLAVFAIWFSLRFGLWVTLGLLLLLLSQKRRELFDKCRFCGYNKEDNESQEVGL